MVCVLKLNNPGALAPRRRAFRRLGGEGWKTPPVRQPRFLRGRVEPALTDFNLRRVLPTRLGIGASTSKNGEAKRRADVSLTTCSRPRRNCRSCEEGRSSRALRRLAWNGGGLRFKRRRPTGVSDNRIPRPSSGSTARRIAPRFSSRSTIPETVDGCAKSRSASSPRESSGSVPRIVSAHTCGPESPVLRRIAFECSWIALKRRLRLLTTSAASCPLTSDRLPTFQLTPPFPSSDRFTLGAFPLRPRRARPEIRTPPEGSRAGIELERRRLRHERSRRRREAVRRGPRPFDHRRWRA